MVTLAPRAQHKAGDASACCLPHPHPALTPGPSRSASLGVPRRRATEGHSVVEQVSPKNMGTSALSPKCMTSRVQAAPSGLNGSSWKEQKGLLSIKPQET